jgi:Mg-chelatase subunit ChlD
VAKSPRIEVKLSGVEGTAFSKNLSAESTRSTEISPANIRRTISSKRKEPLTESEAVELVAAIVSRTRQHPDIFRGVSVRGAIAFTEVLQGFEQLENRRTRGSMEKAALLTLPPRVVTRQGDKESAIAIVSDIVKEVLYGIKSSRRRTGSRQTKDGNRLSLEDFLAALQHLSLSKTLESQELEQDTEKGRIDIVVEKDSSRRLSGNRAFKNSSQRNTKEWNLSLERAIEHLMEELEQKRERGEIPQGAYKFEKSKLEEMLSAASYLHSQMSEKELAETMMEFLDAKDKQWQKELKFEDMYVYYHIKGTSDGKELSLPKQGWYGLKVVVDYLEHQDLVKTDRAGTAFTLTAKALDTLLKHLVPKTSRSDESRAITNRRSTVLNERRQETRKYVLGDVFRDISIRRTLREIARRKKKLSDIDRRDFRVFMKEHRRLKSDIMLCVDSSGSMGFHQKLILARLAAAAIAKTALQRGDRVGIVTFEDLGRMIVPLTDREEAVFSYVARISAGGNTNIGDGIKCATQLLLRGDRHHRKLIVLITDGEPTAISEKAWHQLRSEPERDLTEEYAIFETKRATLSGVETSVLHITDEKSAGKRLVESIAKMGHGQVQKISRPTDLKAVIRQ